MNKPVTGFNRITTLDGKDLLHIVHNNVDKKIEWADLLLLIPTGGAIEDQIVDGVTTKGASQNAIYDALQLKWGGSITAGYYPVSTGPNAFADGRIYQDSPRLYLRSPDTNSYLTIENGTNILRTQAGSTLASFNTSASQASANWQNGSGVSSSLTMSVTSANLLHTDLIVLSAADINLPGLITNSVAVIDTSGNLKGLAAGTNGHVLTLVGGAPTWAAPSGGGGTVTGSGTTNYLSKWTGSSSQGISVLYEDSGKIGLGTTAPNARLHIVTTNSGGIYIDAPETAGPNALEIAADGAVEGLIIGVENGAAINVISTGTGSALIYEGLGIGVSISSDGNIAGKFASSSTAGEFSQKGDLVADSNEDALIVLRDYYLDGHDATGCLLRLSDNTASTGNRWEVKQGAAFQSVLRQNGYLGLGDVETPVYMLTLSGADDRTIGVARNPVAATSGKALYLQGGNAFLGGTNLNGGTVVLMPGTPTGNGTSGIDMYGGSGGSPGTADATMTLWSRMMGDGKWIIGKAGTPSARMELYADHGTFVLGLYNKSLTGTIGWVYENETVSGNNNLIISEKTSTPATVQRFKYHAAAGIAGGAFSIGTVTTALANFHLAGTMLVNDGAQAVGKVWTCTNANGLGTWQTPTTGFTNPMTTIGDIIQANTGGTPQRLGNSTTGTYLRSVSGGLNVWSTLVLPNAATAGNVFFATGTDTMGSLSEFNYNSSSNVLSLIKTADAGVSYSATNLSAGASARARFVAGAGSGNVEMGATSGGYTGTFGANALYVAGSGGTGLNINHDNNIKFSIGSTEYARFQSGGMMIGAASAPDSACIVDISSSTKGVRFPRMTTAEKTAIGTTSKPGLVVFDTDLNKLCVTLNNGTWDPLH